jgi:hypothetical protein
VSSSFACRKTTYPTGFSAGATKKNARRFCFRLPDSGDALGAAQHAKRTLPNLSGR